MSTAEIGYMEGLPKRAAAIIGATTRDIFLSKGMLFSIFVLLLPPLIAVLTLISPQEGFKDWWGIFILFGVVIYLQLLLLIFCLVYGTSIANRDIDNRTMTYLIIRGAKRSEVYFFKYVATIVSLMIMFTLSIFLTYGVLMTHGPIFEMLNRADVLLSLLISTYMGIILYTALFSMMGTIFKRPLIVGLLYAFFWEVVMVNLLYTIADLTIMLYIRSIFDDNSTVSDMIGMRNASDLFPSFLVIFIFTLIFLAVGAIVMSRKDIH
jgi:ABC-type transport system involved in multi-copper enzyme maturation permease subunit